VDVCCTYSDRGRELKFKGLGGGGCEEDEVVIAKEAREF